MEFHQKLEKRIAELELNKSKAARKVGLPESTISSYLSKRESLPRIDIALKIARAIEVPLEWLADSNADWPPPENKPDLGPQLKAAHTDEICSELSQRYLRAATSVLEYWRRIQKMDWRELIGDLHSLPDGQKLPDNIREAANAIFAARATFNTIDFIAHGWENFFLARPDELEPVHPSKVMQAFGEFTENADIQHFDDAFHKRTDPKGLGDFLRVTASLRLEASDGKRAITKDSTARKPRRAK